MTPTAICAGFRRCGVFLSTSYCSISAENLEVSLTRPSDEQTETENGLVENGDENTVTEFSIEQEQRFQTRFEEGCDLMDSEHLHWLEINHPDSVPADRHMLVLASESSRGVSKDNSTLTDVFSYVQPLSPLTVTKCATSSNSTFLNSHASTAESAKTPPTLELPLMRQLQSQLKLLPLLSPPLIQSQLKLLPLPSYLSCVNYRVS